MRLIDRVNRQAVSPDLLREALALHFDLLTAERGAADVRAIRIIEMLHRRELRASDGDLIVAIEVRLGALARLIRNAGAHMNIWVDPGGKIVRPELISAAASESLIYDEQGEPAFDIERLARRIQAIRSNSPGGPSPDQL